MVHRLVSIVFSTDDLFNGSDSIDGWLHEVGYIVKAIRQGSPHAVIFLDTLNTITVNESARFKAHLEKYVQKKATQPVPAVATIGGMWNPLNWLPKRWSLALPAIAGGKFPTFRCFNVAALVCRIYVGVVPINTATATPLCKLLPSVPRMQWLTLVDCGCLATDHVRDFLQHMVNLWVSLALATDTIISTLSGLTSISMPTRLPFIDDPNWGKIQQQSIRELESSAVELEATVRYLRRYLVELGDTKGDITPLNSYLTPLDSYLTPQQIEEAQQWLHRSRASPALIQVATAVPPAAATSTSAARGVSA